MKALQLRLIIGLLFCLVASSWSGPVRVWFNWDENKQAKLDIYLFVSSTCPHCQKADKFFQALQTTYPSMIVHRYVINESKPALELFNEFQQEQKLKDFIVPSIFFCNTRWQGFESIEKNGKQLMAALMYCQEQITKTGYLSSATHQLLEQRALATLYADSLTINPSIQKVLPLLSGLDALSASALFAILTLVAFLMIQRDREWGMAILFLLVIGFTHYLQQAYSNVFYDTIKYLRWFVLIVGVMLVVYVFISHYKKMITKPHRLISAGLMLLTAFSIELFIQLATPNFSLIFQQWLMTQRYSSLGILVYQCLYQCLYIAVIALFVVGFIAIVKAKRFSKHQLFIREIAWCYLMIIGLALIVYPFLLSTLAFLLISVVSALFFAWTVLKIQCKLYRH